MKLRILLAAALFAAFNVSNALELNFLDLNFNFHSTNNDPVNYGFSLAVYPAGFTTLHNGIYLLWFGAGASYHAVFYRSEVHHFLSVFPAAGQWFETGGYCLGIEPMFNVNKFYFERFRFRLEGCFYGLTASFYYDLVILPAVDHRIGFTIGIGVPLPLYKALLG